MRGGKREGAGRKGLGKTKVFRLPIELEPQILELVKQYKSKSFDSVTKSIVPEKPKNIEFPLFNKEQLKIFRQWLVIEDFVKSITEARKKTETPKLCKETFLKHKWFINFVKNNENCKLIYEIDDVLAQLNAFLDLIQVGKKEEN